MQLNEHPLRRQVVGEMHLRRWPQICAPARIFQVLRLVGPEDRSAERAVLATPPLGARPAACDNPRHIQGDLGPGLSYVWEQHSEACGITLFAAEGADPGVALEWISRFPGQVIRATRTLVVADEAEAGRELANMGFTASDVVSCHIGETFGDRRSTTSHGARLWSDFRIGADGFGQMLIAANGMDRQGHGGDMARLLQGLQELGNYRNLALMGLPVAQANWGRLDEAEESLRHLATDVANNAKTDDSLLERVCALSLELISITAETTYRLGATDAYAQLVEDRLAGLCVRPVAGFPSLVDFTQRRLLPATRTCLAFGRRLDVLGARAGHFTALLRTRIETRIENQNARLLHSMERSASLQLRLQQLVEGLSVVALSYYGIGLVGYMLKGWEGLDAQFPAAVVIGALVPVVVGTMWWGIHRLKSKLLGDHQG
jgi:uncharacterized membrane-anchored protein